MSINPLVKWSSFLLLAAGFVQAQKCVVTCPQSTDAPPNCAICKEGQGELGGCWCTTSNCVKGCCGVSEQCGNCIPNNFGGYSCNNPGDCCALAPVTSSWLATLDFAPVLRQLKQVQPSLEVAGLLEKRITDWGMKAQSCGRIKGRVQALDGSGTYPFEVYASPNFLEVTVHVGPTVDQDETFVMRSSGVWAITRAHRAEGAGKTGRFPEKANKAIE